MSFFAKSLIVIFASASFSAPVCAQEIQLERVLWESVRDSDSAAELDLYLQEYPNGTFSSLANIRLKKIKKGKTTQDAIASIESERDGQLLASSQKDYAAVDRLADAFLRRHERGNVTNSELTRWVVNKLSFVHGTDEITKTAKMRLGEIAENIDSRTDPTDYFALLGDLIESLKKHNEERVSIEQLVTVAIEAIETGKLGDLEISLTQDPLIIAGDRDVIGVQVANLTSAIKVEYGLSELRQDGILVVDSYRFGEAFKVGLRSGDVIVKLNEFPVSKISSFVENVGSMSPDGLARLEVWRSGKILNFSVPFGKLAGSALLASRHGDMNASHYLGTLFAGNILGQPDPRRASFYYATAEDQGDPRAVVSLAKHFQDGSGGFPKDLKIAVQILERGVEANNVSAMNALAYLRFIGIDGHPDYWGARKLYEKASNLGSDLAKGNFGYMLMHGTGGSTDFPQGLSNLREASEEGIPIALHGLGDAYRYGQGVSPDVHRAIVHYQDAAGKNFATSHHSLGEMYRTGEGIPKNLEKSIHHHRKAAELGDVGSRQLLEHDLNTTVYDPLEIQELLTGLKFNPGPVDGQIGNATRLAIKDFQTSQNLTADGIPTFELLQHLRRAAR